MRAAARVISPAGWRRPRALAGRLLRAGERALDRPTVAWCGLVVLSWLVALSPPWQPLLLLAAAAGVWGIWTRPVLGLYFLAFSVPFQSLYEARLGGINVTATEGIVLVLVGAVGIRVLTGQMESVRPPPLLVPLLVLVTVLMLSVTQARDLTLSAKELLKWLELLAVYWAGSLLLTTRRQRWTLVGALLAAALAEAGVGVYQFLLRKGPAHFMVGELFMRAYGTFEQPNPFAGYLGLLYPVALALWTFGGLGRLRPVLGWAALTLGGVAALSFSRGAWLGLTAATLAVPMLGNRPARHALVTFGGLGGVLAVGIWPLLPPDLAARITSVVSSAVNIATVVNQPVTPQNWAVMERLSQWYAGWHMFLDHPFLGVGIGNYNAWYRDYRLPAWPLALGHAHNIYLTLAAEAGTVGLTAYLLLMVAVAASGAQAMRAAAAWGDRAGYALVLGSLAGLVNYSAHSTFDVLFVHGVGVVLALLLALTQQVAQEGAIQPSARPAAPSPAALRPAAGTGHSWTAEGAP